MSDEEQILVFSDFPSEGEMIEQMLRELSGGGVQTVIDEETAFERLSADTPEIVFAHLQAGAAASTYFLNEVWTRKPQTTRFLVGDSTADSDALIRCALGPHQFIPGPISSEKLDAALLRAEALKRFVRDEKIRELISRMRTLPSRPALSIEVMRELRSSTASAGAVGDLISKDIAISTKLIQVANSAFYSAQQQVSTPAEAVLLLGLEATAALVLSIETFARLDKLKPLYFSMDRVWKHSQSVAELTRKLCQIMDCPAETAAHAHTAALLHDIGKLALAQNFQEDYERILKQSEENSLPLHQLEKDFFGATHAETGAYLLALWGLPLPIVEAVAYHHVSAQALSPAFSGATALRLANQLIHSPDKIEKILAEYPRELGFGRHLDQFRALLGSKARSQEKAPSSPPHPGPEQNQPNNPHTTAPSSATAETQNWPVSAQIPTKSRKQTTFYIVSVAIIALLAATGFFWPESTPVRKKVENRGHATTTENSPLSVTMPAKQRGEHSANTDESGEFQSPLAPDQFRSDPSSFTLDELPPEQASAPELSADPDQPGVGTEPFESAIVPQARAALNLQAIMYAGDRSSLILNGSLLHVGDSVEGWQVVSIREHEVTLQNGTEQRILGLR